MRLLLPIVFVLSCKTYSEEDTEFAIEADADVDTDTDTDADTDTDTGDTGA